MALGTGQYGSYVGSRSCSRTIQVAVVGQGAVGRPVANAIRDGGVCDATLSAVVDSTGSYSFTGVPISFELALQTADLVVEAAGQGALGKFGPRVIAAGVDLLALSVGALADKQLYCDLAHGPGRLYLSAGAIGGLDILRTLADAKIPILVRVCSTKRPATVILKWMTKEQKTALAQTTTPVEVLSGTPEDLAVAFPRSANVVMTVAIAAGAGASVFATMRADPECTTTSHDILIDSRVGTYKFQIHSFPSPDSPATSGLVPLAVLRALRDLIGAQEEVMVV